MTMETIMLTGKDWIDLSDKLTKITFTNDKKYLIQSQDCLIRCYQGSELPENDFEGMLIKPIDQCFKFTFATGDVIGIRLLNASSAKHITISEVA